MKTVLVAGATGYLGRQIVAEYMSRDGWSVRALVRSAESARSSGLEATDIVEGHATEPETLAGIMADVDVVVSALGITRQRDGLTYMDVDYRGNRNLLDEALRTDKGPARFAYVHVLGSQNLLQCEGVRAKQKFVDELRAADIASTIVCPSGFFSDMGDFLDMARGGRVWLFGDGSHRINPIDAADLSVAIANAIDKGIDGIEIGGPDVLTHREIAELAFEVLDKPTRITYLPDALRRSALWVLPKVTPTHIGGPAEFFLTAFGMDVVGECYGTRHLRDHFEILAKASSDATRQNQ